MKTSTTGINLIKSFEGFSPKACKCVSTEKYYTIGYGHYGEDVKPGQTITEAEAVKLLKSDVAKIESAVNKYATKYKWNQNQFDAIASFTYNCGAGNLNSLTNNGKRTNKEISEKMVLYCKSGGVRLNGLYKRRLKEQILFNKEVKVDLNKVAKDVIAGKYGNGSERKKNLEAAGYDYKAVQEVVNKLLKG